MRGWRSTQVYGVGVLFSAIAALLGPHASAELISAGGRVTLIRGSVYYPVSAASDGNILSRWATDSPGGYQSDYFATGPVPILLLDLGTDVTVSAIAFWGFGTSGPSNNSASRLSLRFATQDEGADHMGVSISYAPEFAPANLSQSQRQDFQFSQFVTARYIEITISDNYFDPARPTLGGDRVGLSEVQFERTWLNQASDPQPADGAVDVEIPLTLRWATAVVPDPFGAQTAVPNPDIVMHQVYLSRGDSAELFLLGEVEAGRPVAASAQFGPVPLHEETRYYWRIDEYISPTQILTGPVWSFTTQAKPAPCVETDLNDDCRVDTGDLLIFAQEWLADMFSPADFIGRDGVNLNDFALLSARWGDIGPRLVITEFMAANDAFMQDEDGMTSDWIEIYNPTAATVPLEGWYLSDDPAQPDKWRFPDVSIGSGGYRVIFASGRDRAQAGLPLHTNFVLEIEGEYLALVRPDGRTVEHAWSTVPGQYEDISFGLATHPGRSKPEGCYFLTPTPGTANREPYPNTGPGIANVSHEPQRPTTGEAVTVTATISEIDAPVSTVTLIWRVMFNNEQTTSMYDDGLHNDGEAGDGVYGGIIPAGAAAAGQMLRYYVKTVDALGHENRLPLPLDQTGENQSPRYFGTVAADPSVQSQLPVMEWFTTDPSASHSRTGARACVYYEGQFYDNIYVRQRGQATNAYSQKFDFNKGFDFYVNDRLGSVGEINMNAQGADPAYIRQSLAFDTHTWCGTPSCESFLVLMQLNGRFDRVGVLIEQVDEDFLRRHGRDPDGALYKFVQRSAESQAQADPIHYPYLPHTPCFSDTNNGIEKKNRLWEDFSDLQAVVNGLMAATELERQRFVFDNFNLPEMMNYLAARAVSNDCDDTRKNFYFYRDTNGTGEWEIYPWDNDFTFGVYGDGGPYRDHPFFGDEQHLKTGTNQWNVFFDVMFKLPQTRQMYLRRLRTMMDRLLQPPGTPAGELKYEPICDAMATPLAPHISVSVAGVKSFFPTRRNELYAKYGPGGVEPLIPHAQGGQTELIVTSTLISGNPGETVAYYHVPTDDALGTQWRQPDFNQMWPTGYTGIGYERRPGDSVNFTSLIRTDVYAMMAGRTSIYIRIPFQIDDPAMFDSLILRMKYDDGFVAYLNGNGIPPRQFTGEPKWDSGASGGRSDGECMVYEDIVLPASWLLPGANVLAIHGLNYGASSTDLLFLPELQGAVITTVGGGIADQLSIIAVDDNPVSGNQDEEYVEIANSGAEAVDISGWHLTGGVEFEFRPGTVIPGNSRIYVSPNVKAFRGRTISPRGGQGRFVVGNYRGHLSSWGETLILADTYYGTVSTFVYPGRPSVQQQYLRITEIMYHPAAGGPYNEEEYEYVELKNIGAQPLLLDGVKFTQGVLYEFTPGANEYLSGDECLVLVKNREAFASRYGTGQIRLAPRCYTGSLSNTGETINLEDSTNSTILKFDYDDDWYKITDGGGFSLNIVDVRGTLHEDWGRRRSWRAGTYKHGTPGVDDVGPPPDTIVINEVLAHSHDPDPLNPTPDWIELKNTTGADIDIGGWFMSDSDADDTGRKKYEFPEGTTVPAKGYRALYQDQSFGNAGAPGCHVPFGLSEGGETVYLYSGLNGEITGYYSTQQRFAASAAGVTLGRYEKESLSSGYDFTALAAATPGEGNAEPRLSDLVISEIMYNPSADNTGEEYIELHNLGAGDVEMMSWAQTQYSSDPTDIVSEYLPWVLTDAVEYTFPRNTVIAAGGYIVVAKVPEAFKQRYPGVDPSKVFGPFDGRLNNGGENLKLAEPGDKEYSQDRYYIVVERVEYDNAAPWPTSADGGGTSLHRINARQYANDPENWQARIPSPGS